MAVKEELLVVDDSRSSLTWLSQLMSSAGYGVICAQSGEEALALLATARPDLILLDVDMPGMSGLELCAAIKRQPALRHVPVIFQSVLTDSGVRIQGLEVGAADFLSKPYQPDEILLRVQIHLRLYSLQTKLEHTVAERTRELTAEIAERQQIEAELIESRRRLRALTTHLQDIREEERKRIAREIHDELGQVLSVSQIELGRLAGLLKKEPREVLRLLDNVISSVAGAANIARSISENLRPGMLDVLGLAPALENHIKTFESATGLPCAVMLALPDGLALDDQYATTVFRIVQEALTNIAKHARASRVSVSVRGSDDGLLVIVEDDGLGLDATTDHQRKSFGLLGMSERTQMLDGELTVESGPAGGTKVEAFLPIARISEYD